MTEQNGYKGVRKEGESKYIYNKRYWQSHPEKIAHLKAREYARKKNAVGFHTLEQWELLKKQANYCCAFCQKQTKLTKDHIIHLSKGGTDYIDNIQPLCRSCNSQKNV